LFSFWEIDIERRLQLLIEEEDEDMEEDFKGRVLKGVLLEY
jgi:hypothetical protein